MAFSCNFRWHFLEYFCKLPCFFDKAFYVVNFWTPLVLEILQQHLKCKLRQFLTILIHFWIFYDFTHFESFALFVETMVWLAMWLKLNSLRVKLVVQTLKTYFGPFASIYCKIRKLSLSIEWIRTILFSKFWPGICHHFWSLTLLSCQIQSLICEWFLFRCVWFLVLVRSCHISKLSRDFSTSQTL